MLHTHTHIHTHTNVSVAFSSSVSRTHASPTPTHPHTTDRRQPESIGHSRHRSSTARHCAARAASPTAEDVHIRHRDVPSRHESGTLPRRSRSGAPAFINPKIKTLKGDAISACVRTRCVCCARHRGHSARRRRRHCRARADARRGAGEGGAGGAARSAREGRREAGGRARAAAAERRAPGRRTPLSAGVLGWRGGGAPPRVCARAFCPLAAGADARFRRESVPRRVCARVHLCDWPRAHERRRLCAAYVGDATPRGGEVSSHAR